MGSQTTKQLKILVSKEISYFCISLSLLLCALSSIYMNTSDISNNLQWKCSSVLLVYYLYLESSYDIF